MILIGLIDYMFRVALVVIIVILVAVLAAVHEAIAYINLGLIWVAEHTMPECWREDCPRCHPEGRSHAEAG